MDSEMILCDIPFREFICFSDTMGQPMEIYSQVRMLKPAYFRTFFKHAANFFNSAPWTTLESRDTVQIKAYGESRVLQIRGFWGI